MTEKWCSPRQYCETTFLLPKHLYITYRGALPLLLMLESSKNQHTVRIPDAFYRKCFLTQYTHSC